MNSDDQVKHRRAIEALRSGVPNRDAVLALEPEAAVGLEQRARLAEQACLVTGSYLVDAERRAGQVRAAHIRERMRALGPTVRPDLGKQAEGKANSFAAPEGV